jgi:hypothetical protein
MQHDLVAVLMSRWRHQIGRHFDGSHRRPYRRIGAFELLAAGNKFDGLVELGQLTLVLLHDEESNKFGSTLRLSGYRPRRVSNGVEWGWRAKGQRCHLGNPKLLQKALQLDAWIHQAHRYLCGPRLPKLQLPALWAGFEPEAARQLTGQGPEFELLCRRFDIAPAKMFQIFERKHRGLRLFPLDWVSEQLTPALSIFADLSDVPRRQLFRLRRLPDDLVGFQGASAFDFFSSRFRTGR